MITVYDVWKGIRVAFEDAFIVFRGDIKSYYFIAAEQLKKWECRQVWCVDSVNHDGEHCRYLFIRAEEIQDVQQ